MLPGSDVLFVENEQVGFEQECAGAYAQEIQEKGVGKVIERCP